MGFVFKSELDGAPASLARKIAVAKKEAAKARAGKNSFPQPPPFCSPDWASPPKLFGGRTAGRD